MGILDRDFESAINSMEDSFIRCKMGVDKGNKFIQDTYNKIYNGHHCGFNKD